MRRTPRVLIVEDDRQIVQALTIRLRAVGYETVAVYDGATCIDTARDAGPDVIVLDIRMPGMDGLDALAKLRVQENTRHIPVIIHSANVTNETKSAALESGSAFVLQKPCDTQNLVDAIQVTIAK